MAIPRANGFALLSAEIEEPRVGRWMARITADVEENEVIGDPGDAITLDFEDGTVTYVGTILRGAVFAGVYSGTVIGGAGGLATDVPSKSYIGVPMAIILEDLMVLTGETLDSTTDADVKSLTLQHWNRTSGQAQNALDAIREAASADWRMFRSGTLWFGTDTFPESTFDFTEEDRDPSFAERIIAPESGAPELSPGVTFNDEQVQYVTTSLTSSDLTQSYLV